MVTVLLADIHGNAVALAAALRDARRHAPDAYLCLGDVAATGPQPRECIELVRRLECPVVLGNTDAWLVEPQVTPSTDEAMQLVQDIDQWCREQLRPADLAYLASFPPSLSRRLGRTHSLLCCHGSPQSYDHEILPTTPDEQLAELLGSALPDVLAAGHTHVPMLRKFRTSTLVNPGSVGLPFTQVAPGRVEHPAVAEYAVIRSDPSGSLDVALTRCPVDLDQLVEAVRSSGMPHGAAWLEGWVR